MVACAHADLSHCICDACFTAPATTSRAVLNNGAEQSLHHPPKYGAEHSLTYKTGAPSVSLDSEAQRVGETGQWLCRPLSVAALSCVLMLINCGDLLTIIIDKQICWQRISL